MPDRYLDLLREIDSPDDLRALPRGRLGHIASELRDYLLHSVSRTGGHLAANLGVIELTLALHYCLNTPEDRIVFDVGHQAYAHKILTGRRAGMAALRSREGLSGFTRRAESIHDPFGAGHSSTSISAALGMALAARLKGEKRRAVAVIGDGAMTAGQAFEALNHAGSSGANLLVVLNDNEMSISPNVGALTEHLTRLRTAPVITRLREGSRELLTPIPPLRQLVEEARSRLKGALGADSLFEQLGFDYYGPIDGHDLPLLIDTLDNIKDLPGPIMLHVVTQKGRGYSQAESDPTRFHGVGRFDPAAPGHPAAGAMSWTDGFAQWLARRAAKNTRLVAITPAMKEGSGLTGFAERFPERFFDVGIAEQHAVTLAGGLATEGMKPVVAIYSTFLQRGYDQLIHDIALQDLDVLFAIDRAGQVGPDGATHAGSFDIAFLQCIPNMLLMAPANADSLSAMLDMGLEHPGPAAVRYPRGAMPELDDLPPVEFGKAAVARRSSIDDSAARVLLIAVGSLLAPSRQVAEMLDATLVDLRFIKPLDLETVLGEVTRHSHVVTLEEGAILGGVGQTLAAAINAAGFQRPLLTLGIPDRFIEHGSREQCLADCGLDPETIAVNIRRFMTDSVK